MSFNGKRFTLEGLFRSLFTELWPSFPLVQLKIFQLKIFQSSVGGLLIFFSFELYYSLFHILMIKSNYWVDRPLFNFLFNSSENSLIGQVCFGHKDIK